VPDKDPTGEYLAMRDAAAVVDPGWSAVRVTGGDAVSFLQGLLSQDLVPGTCRRTFLLGPRGKLRAIAWAITDAESVLLVTESGRSQTLVDDLSRYRIRVDATVEPDDRVVHLVVGPGADEALGVDVPVGGWVESGGAVVADASFGGRTRRVVVGEPASLAGIVAAGPAAATAVRIELGEPVMDVDVDEGTIPQETGLVPTAVDFDKGCYLGQELVARIDSRGRVNQRLVGIWVATNVIPPVGAVVVVDETELGTVTSVGESLDLRAPVGLAVVRREAEDGTPVRLRWDGGSADATVVPLPMGS
jgi:aminomethyltransferase